MRLHEAFSLVLGIDTSQVVSVIFLELGKALLQGLRVLIMNHVTLTRDSTDKEGRPVTFKLC